MRFFPNLVLAAVIGAMTLPAATITGYTLQYNGSNVSPGPIGDVVPSGDGAYLVSGTLDLYETISGNPVQAGTPFTGPFALRFTDALIACSAATFCGPAVFNFTAYVTFDGTAPTDVAGLYGADGFGNGTSFFSVGVEGASSFLEIANISTDGAFDRSAGFPAGFLVSNTSNSLVLAMGIVFNGGLPADGSVYMPGSLFQQVGLADTVPEPGTLAIVTAGLAGAFWFRRRQQ